MHLSFDINISFIDIFFLGYLVYASWLGYKQGALVKALSLFALSGGFLLSVLFTFMTFRFFYTNGSYHPELFSALVLLLFFSLAVWFSEYVQNTVAKQTKEIQIGKKGQILGGVFGFVKSFLIASTYVLILLSLNISGNFLPRTEARSIMGNVSAFILGKTVRMLKPMTDRVNEFSYLLEQKKEQQMIHNQQPVRQPQPQNQTPPAKQPQKQDGNPQKTEPVVQPYNINDNFSQ